MRSILVIFGVVTVALSSPVAQEESVLRSVVGNFVNCVNSDELNICLKEHALKAAERLGSVRKLRISDSVTIFNNGEQRESRSLEPLSTDPEVKSRQLTDRLWQNFDSLLKTSELELSYASDDDDEESRDLGEVDEGRGKKKKIKKKIKALIPLAILAKIKAIFLGLLAIWIIALSLAKIAVIAKVAFIAKIIALLKALLSKKSSHQEEVWVSAPPHHEEHGGGGHGWESSGGGGGWSRSRPDASNLAYSAYRK